jgi:2-succinyl-5-enolpyruvyl-6-hydroxy-3-cyclohexene-1-carboxylate synthase
MKPGTNVTVGATARMIPVNSTYAPLQAFVDELARCGMTHAVTSPGSRNAPLALTLAGDPRLRAVSVLDERSAGFFALGMAKSTGRPVAVTCTSGSAAANLLPAVVEAHEARVPLLVLTADRPPELRDTGAGQAIDQLELYGSFAKWFVEVGNFSPGREAAVHFRALACRAWHTALGGRPGVVHLNFPLREPLAPVPEQLDAADWEGRPDGGPWVQLHAPASTPPADLVDGMAARVRSVSRGAIVCGSAGEEVAESVASLAAATGWPVLADPLSGLRCGPHDRSHVISHYDVLLRSDAWAAAHVPELVLRLGDTPTSKPLRAWLARASQLVVDPHAVWHEPTRVAETIVQAAPGPLCAAVAEAVSAEPDQQWLRGWREADDLVPAALADAAANFEPHAWVAAVEAAPPGALIWVASSMPIRDVESFLPSLEKPLTFLSNRGANGIDGTVSSAAGAALATGRPVVLLIGELALLHDIGGLLAARRAGAELTIVCANNGGGGIFDFLPVAGAANPELYEEHIVTPSGVDLERVAALADMPYANEIGAGPGLIEVRTDRAENVAQHRALFARVAEQLA